MFSSAASSNRLVSRSDHSCVFRRLMSLHRKMKPSSRVGLRLMRSQRPFAIKASRVACDPLSQRISTCSASAEPCKAGSSCASGVPGLSSAGATPSKSAACALASTMPSFAVDDDDAFLRVFQRVGEPRLRRTALRHLAVHHRLDVVAHHAHGGEQRTELVGAALGHGDVELAGGNALGDVGGDRHRPDDAPRQRPGHQRRQQPAPTRCRAILSWMSRATVGARGLAVQKAVAGGVVHQEIDLIVDLVGVAVERLPIDVALAAVEQALAISSSSR